MLKRLTVNEKTNIPSCDGKCEMLWHKFHEDIIMQTGMILL